MIRYTVRRLILLFPVTIAISVLVFSLLVAMPGDPLDALVVGDPSLTREDVEQIKELYGVNDPMPVQYMRWAGRLVQGDFGFSRAYRLPVLDLILPRMQNTMVLATASLLIGLGVAIPLGIYSAVRQYSIADYLVTLFSFFGFAIPNFWLGLVMIIIFSVHLGWLPPGGVASVDVAPTMGAQLVDRVSYLVMPVLVLGLASMAHWTRYMRSSMLEVVQQDYVRTAQAKGLSDRRVIYGHVVKNALIPVVTLIANTIPTVLGGSIIVETVFAYPGMGKLLYDSLLGNDHSVSMTILLFLAVMVLLFNLLADISYGWLDPRIRYE